MNDTIFFRLLDDEAKPMDLAGAVEQIRNDGGASHVYSLDQTSFRQVPGSTFAYWITPALMSAFEEYEPLEGNAATVKVGLQTGDDFRYVRAFWEICPKDIVSSGRPPSGWVPHAKGGETLPFYADIHLLVKWHRNGEDIKQHSSSRPQNSDFYFCSGLTFPYRTFRLSPAVLPEGCITGVTGMGIFPIKLSPSSLLTILNSEVVNQLISVWLGRIDLESLYQAGVIQPVPLPNSPYAKTATATSSPEAIE